LVVSEKAQEESVRMQSQCSVINPIKLEENLIQDITSIDGAVLLDPKGQCYAIGVILDGLASDDGDPGRGARYNSAIRYIDSKKDSIAFVISEDGTIDLVPNLMPQVSRIDIDNMLLEIKRLLGKTEINEVKCNKFLDWFDTYRFYLLESDCTILNQLIEKLENEPYKTGEIRIVHNRFKPNNKMNNSYYL
jgi:hypothetical protein